MQLRFVPILAGATWRDRLLACAGAMACIGLTGLICGLAANFELGLPALMAPVGASAVLLFAVPSSPLAQPLPIIGGNLISALAGWLATHLLHQPVPAAGLAVALAIVAMSLSRSLHPPGGAVALGTALALNATPPVGFAFIFLPLALNCVLLVALGCMFHRLSGHSYPHVPAAGPVNRHGTRDAAPALRAGFRTEDIDAALAEAGEAFDIGREDLDRLLRRVEAHAASRLHGDLSCADIMSRDVLCAGADMEPGAARRLLLDHNIRALPVLDRERRPIGMVGLRDLMRPADRVGDAMMPPVTAGLQDAAFTLAARLSEGSMHAVMIVDRDGRLAGLVTQTDLLSALTRQQVREEGKSSPIPRPAA